MPLFYVTQLRFRQKPCGPEPPSVEAWCRWAPQLSRLYPKTHWYRPENALWPNTSRLAFRADDCLSSRAAIRLVNRYLSETMRMACHSCGPQPRPAKGAARHSNLPVSTLYFTGCDPKYKRIPRRRGVCQVTIGRCQWRDAP